MPNNQIENVRNIAKRVNEIGKEQGLKLLNFSLNPSLDESPDRVTLMFEFDPEGVKEPEIVIQQANKELSDAMEDARREELERKRLKAREDLDSLDEKMGGKQDFLKDFLDDDNK